MALSLSLLLTGCASAPSSSPLSRPFVFGQDTFAYPNELVWEYQIDPLTGRTTHRPREPKPEYHHQCLVMARSARQFFQFARFDPDRPLASPETYRQRVQQVVTRDPARSAPPDSTVVIPGFASLHEFSQTHEELLKKQCGGVWRNYFQRGHWRMTFPFSRAHQAKTADALTESIRAHCPPVVHLVSFPSLSINHALLLYRFTEVEGGIVFQAYDPNDARQPATLRYDATGRTFTFPANRYFKGGSVNVYQIYRSLCY